MNKKTNNEEFNFSIMSLIKFIVAVLIVFIAFYGITVLVTNKKENKKDENNVSIQYDEILVGQILNRSEKSYYVLVQDSTDTESYYQYVGSSKNTSKVYYSELKNSFNKNYKSEESNLFVDDISDIRFNKTTLLEVEDGKIKGAYTDSGITEKLDANISETE